MNLQFANYTQNLVTIKSLGLDLFPIYFSDFRLEAPACPYPLAHSGFGLIFAPFWKWTQRCDDVFFSFT